MLKKIVLISLVFCVGSLNKSVAYSGQQGHAPVFNAAVELEHDELSKQLFREIRFFGRLQKFHELVERGACIHALGQHGRTCLHMAVIHARKDIVTYLIKSGADIQARDEFGCIPLHYAAQKDVDLLNLVFNKNFLEIKDKLGNTPLHKAAAALAVDCVKFLVDQKANTAPNHLDQKPIDLAVQHEEFLQAHVLRAKRVAVMELLLGRKLNDGEYPMAARQADHANHVVGGLYLIEE